MNFGIDFDFCYPRNIFIDLSEIYLESVQNQTFINAFC